MVTEMTKYDWYIFFLCLVVFVALTSLFCIMIASIVRLTVKLLRSGAEDEELLREKERCNNSKKKGTAKAVFEKAAGGIAGIIVLLLLCFALFINLCGNSYFCGIPAVQAVKSCSMAQKDAKNTYLYENHLDDQIQLFDLIMTYRLPDEFDLELYDIVVYELKGTRVIHRIVGIEEPNEKHPGERLFTLQGDAVDRPDMLAVKYSQMKGIYRGDRLPFAGSFAMFMQSPAGWLCVLLAVFAVVASPIVERKITAEKEKRLALLEAWNNKSEDGTESGIGGGV